jgi:hypothetical protein
LTFTSSGTGVPMRDATVQLNVIPVLNNLLTRFVVAAELHHGESSTEKEGVLRQPPPAVALRDRGGRRQPPTALNLSKVYEIESSSCRDSGTSNNRDSSATSGSLNLSQHNTGSQVRIFFLPSDFLTRILSRFPTFSL